MSENSADKPKIIIDEDWKSQVQSEKEKLEQQKSQPSPEAFAGRGRLPPASLATLATTLATQSLMSMGQIAHPATGKAEIHLDEARHFIDTIDVLLAKTVNNRTPEETSMLDNLLHELRMIYVNVQQQSSNLTASPQ